MDKDEYERLMVALKQLCAMTNQTLEHAMNVGWRGARSNCPVCGAYWHCEHAQGVLDVLARVGVGAM